MKDLDALVHCPDLALYDSAPDVEEVPDLVALVGGIASASPTAVFDLHDLVAQCAEKEGFQREDAEEILVQTVGLVIDAIWDGALVEPALLSGFIGTILRVHFKLRSKQQQDAARPVSSCSIQ